jgi:hypothetical protein
VEEKYGFLGGLVDGRPIWRRNTDNNPFDSAPSTPIYELAGDESRFSNRKKQTLFGTS